MIGILFLRDMNSRKQWTGSIFLITVLLFSPLRSAADVQPEPVDSIPADMRTERVPVTPYTFQPKSLILPGSLIAIGAIGTAIDGMNDFHLFSRNNSERRKIRVDDYLEWGMLGWVFACDLVGQEKHSWTDQLLLLVLAEGMNAGMVHGLKNMINEPRPDGGPRSFPSGHTANAFLGAHLAFKEFKDSNRWIAWSGYTVATFVGISRLYNNRHWLSDVIAGAGFGILSVELAYLIYFPVRNAVAGIINHKLNNLTLSPTFDRGGGGSLSLFSFLISQFSLTVPVRKHHFG